MTTDMTPTMLRALTGEALAERLTKMALGHLQLTKAERAAYLLEAARRVDPMRERADAALLAALAADPVPPEVDRAARDAWDAR